MSSMGFDAIVANLDPGAELLPYEPEIDIREWIVLSDVMHEYGLGPNGAQIVCADLLALRAGEVKALLDRFHSDYVLFDTPGQVELFAFREASRHVVNLLGADRSMLVFLFDPLLARIPSGFVALLMLCATVQFRFSIPMVNVLSKSDMLSEADVAKIVEWSEDAYKLNDALMAERSALSLDISTHLFRALDAQGVYKTIIPASSQTRFGFEDIYNAAQQTFAGGEDLTQD